MTHPAIKVEGLSKEYIVGHARERHGTFYDLLASTLKAPLKRLRNLGGYSQETERFWALKDVNFKVQPGEVVGVIGRNGAGKSTLLKILSRITAPTKGRIEVRGRLASLLEVGTGFHPELSGRENIYLNGAILGMTRAEVARKFDEIVAFSEIERFIDTPVKRYSSGMYVRLAFAVAAHLDADVLLVDEVLAVGDAAFQKKSLGMMNDVAHSGRTVMFVSHNLGAVRNLCSLVMLLENGALRFHGATLEGLAMYEQGFVRGASQLDRSQFQGPLAEHIQIERLVCMQEGAPVFSIDPLQEFEIEVHGMALREFRTLDLSIGLFRDGFHIAVCHDTPHEALMHEGRFVSRFKVPARVLRPGRYDIGIGVASIGAGLWMWGADIATLEFLQNWGGQCAERNRGAVALPYTAERIQ